jgi:hypothetical protein
LSVVFKPFRLSQADDLHAQLPFVTNDSGGLLAFRIRGGLSDYGQNFLLPFSAKGADTFRCHPASAS